MIQLLKKYVLNPIVNSARPRFCPNILDRARLEKWPVEKIQEPFVLDLVIPNGCAGDEKIRAGYESQRRTEFSAQYLVCLPNAFALGGFVRLASGEFLNESAWRVRDFLASDISRSRYHRHKLYLEGDCYYLDVLFSSNYAHWLADELPRLASALPFLPPYTRFIVSDPVQQYKLDSLAAFGITQDRLVPVKGYYEIRCERLWYATPANDMVWNLQAWVQVRDALLRMAGDVGEPASARVFISRNGSPERKRLANEDELLPLIEDYGFSVVRPERMSLAQQVRALSKAKVVLGAHGAGMTNLLFSPSGTQLLELQDALFAPRLWYWKKASMLGHDYCTMIGSAKESKGWLDTDFTIHPDSLKQFLESSLAAADGQPKKQWWVSQ